MIIEIKQILFSRPAVLNIAGFILLTPYSARSIFSKEFVCPVK